MRVKKFDYFPLAREENFRANRIFRIMNHPQSLIQFNSSIVDKQKVRKKEKTPSIYAFVSTTPAPPQRGCVIVIY